MVGKTQELKLTCTVHEKQKKVKSAALLQKGLVASW